MPFYMVQAAYSATSWAAMVKSPEDREKAFRQLIEKAGCKLVSFYFCFGEDDVVGIFEAPDNATAAAIAMTVAGGGALSKLETTVLIGMDEAQEAMRKAASATYRTPGG